MTPEQRARKNAADRARRLRIKAGKVAPRAIESGGLVAPTAPSTLAEVVDAKIAATQPKARPKPSFVPADAPAARTAFAPAAKKATKQKTDKTGRTVGERMRVITFKGTAAHYDAFHAAGAGAWLRGVLDAGVASKHIRIKK